MVPHPHVVRWFVRESFNSCSPLLLVLLLKPGHTLFADAVAGFQGMLFQCIFFEATDSSSTDTFRHQAQTLKNRSTRLTLRSEMKVIVIATIATIRTEAVSRVISGACMVSLAHQGNGMADPLIKPEDCNYNKKTTLLRLQSAASLWFLSSSCVSCIPCVS